MRSSTLLRLRTRRDFHIGTLALVAAIALSSASMLASSAQTASTTGGLKIVVITGEDAINIIQQKTAVAPIVEVRDRNDQPVAGAIVSFAIRGGRATFGGARTLTVTTNAAGRAMATGFTPAAKGALQISTSAAFQGQTAAITITQTNVLTAAEAAAVSSAGGSGSGAAAGGGSAGGGGGLSVTTLGIVGGAVAGGAIVATKALGAGGGTRIYTGSFRLEAVQLNHQTQGNGIVNLTCTATIAYIGTLTAEIEELAGGTVRGNILNQSNATELSRTCPFSSASSDGPQLRSDVTGTTGNLQSTVQFTSPDGVGISAQSFSGVLSGDTITGTFTHSYSYRTIPTANGFFSDGTFPPTSATVTLQKQ